MPKQTANDANLQKLNEEIYKHSLELAEVNKTLSLLRKLYQISLLTLDPDQLSEKISDTVRVDLNMEVVGVFSYEEAHGSLKPFKFSMTERFSKSIGLLPHPLDKEVISNPEANPLLHKVISQKASQVTGNIEEVFGEWINPDLLKKVNKAGHLQTVLLYPLLTQDKIIGVFFLGLNRSYDTLSENEQELLPSLVDVVAVALDKALLYAQLEEANKQLVALDKARAEFISIASHQLRTPPATIKWYLGAVLNKDFGDLSTELRAALERANVTNDAQISTIDDLLNASRIERGKLEFFFQTAPLEKIVSDLVEQMQPLAQMKKMHIVYRRPQEAFPDIMMDKEKVRQVINNMIDNAIKYSKQGDILVSVEKTKTDLVVKVTDSGKGITPDELKSIFNKYTRGHDSVTHATGLGLGMYVAKIIIEQHNGHIWAESQGMGKGSTFAFSLPIESKIKDTSIDLAQGA